MSDAQAAIPSLRERADSLLSSGEARLAAIEFERMAYAATSNADRTFALLRKANCFAAMEDFESAMETANRITYFSLSDSLVYEGRFMTAYYAYLSGEFEMASSSLYLVHQLLPEKYHNGARVLYALCLNEQGQWDEGREQMNQWIYHTYTDTPYTRDSLLAVVDYAYLKRKRPKAMDPERWPLLSLMLPGSVQLITGHPVDAIFSATMVAIGVAAVAVGVYSGLAVVTGVSLAVLKGWTFPYFISSFLLGGMWTQRFQGAGFKRAEFLIKKRNYERHRKYNDQLRDLIVDIQP